MTRDEMKQLLDYLHDVQTVAADRIRFEVLLAGVESQMLSIPDADSLIGEFGLGLSIFHERIGYRMK